MNKEILTPEEILKKFPHTTQGLNSFYGANTVLNIIDYVLTQREDKKTITPEGIQQTIDKIKDWNKTATTQAESFEKQKMESSKDCSYAMAFAYKACYELLKEKEQGQKEYTILLEKVLEQNYTLENHYEISSDLLTDIESFLNSTPNKPEEGTPQEKPKEFEFECKKDGKIIKGVIEAESVFEADHYLITNYDSIIKCDYIQPEEKKQPISKKESTEPIKYYWDDSACKEEIEEDRESMSADWRKDNLSTHKDKAEQIEEKGNDDVYCTHCGSVDLAYITQYANGEEYKCNSCNGIFMV